MADLTESTSPGWSFHKQGFTWGTDGLHRFSTMLQVLALHSPEEWQMFAQPTAPPGHVHAWSGDDCPCMNVWLSGDMPPRLDLLPVPRRPGVYICYDDEGREAYVGTSRSNVRARLQAHHRDPGKPALKNWLGFWPSQFGDSAAIWEIRLIERLAPYLNRQHVDHPAAVQWDPKPPAPGGPWYENDPDYLWFIDGPGTLLPLHESPPWRVASMVRRLRGEGTTDDEFWDACEITYDKEPEGPAMAYMVGVIRNRRLQRQGQ